EENCLNHISEYSDIVDGSNFKYYGPTSTPQLSLQAADVFCLPSYREGFGLSVIEASCLELPVICSDAYGMADTMVDTVTGVRCKVGDAASLTAAMKYLYDNPDERRRMGENGRKRVLDLFSGEKIVGAWVEYYHSLLK
ncbi:MAG: glycosyltransferase, partial [Muribaculaceae bacterium]|nr:glycosyltransferase [Muribaculaceae bacterium]